MSQAGYSKTPLAKKLGIKEGYTILLHNQPAHYFTLFDDLPEVNTATNPEKESVDFIHLFFTTEEDFKRTSIQYKPFLKKNGLLWISWPKGTSKIKTDLKREPIRDCLLQNGMVDVKVAAIDEDWSGLKFVYRVKDR